MKKKTHDYFVREVQQKRGDTIEFLSPYINAKTKVKIRCKVCGSEYSANPRQLINSKVNGCKYCEYSAAGKVNGVLGGSARKYNYADAKRIIEQDEDYVLLSKKFETVKFKLKIKHKTCNQDFDMDLDHFMQGNRCPFCKRNPIINTEIFRKRIHEQTSGEFELAGDYTGAKNPVELFHKRCNQNIKIIPDTFRKSPYCPYCNQSKGERKIEEYLIQHNYCYKKEYSFDDLRSKNNFPLRYDFSIWIDGKQLLVEYDGEFHFRKYFDEQHFEIQQEHDEMKNVYAHEHNIPLLRIPYTQFDEIEGKLEVFLSKYA